MAPRSGAPSRRLINLRGTVRVRAVVGSERGWATARLRPSLHALKIKVLGTSSAGGSQSGSEPPLTFLEVLSGVTGASRDDSELSPETWDLLLGTPFMA